MNQNLLDFSYMMLMRLSQGYLNLLETCPRKFQHSYLEQLSSPLSPEKQENLAWGKRFHLLMQQKELGLPVEHLLKADPPMWESFQAIAQAAPEIFLGQTLGKSSQGFREAEHLRTLTIEDVLLTVIYDLLIADDSGAKIIDWKTYPRPQIRRKVADNWQTRLYLYVLAETTDYLPEQISMTYWFVQSAKDRDSEVNGKIYERSPETQRLKFSYDRPQHEQTKQDLSQLLTRLQGWFKDYQLGQPFPQVPESSKKCQSCQFAVLCQRDRNFSKSGQEAIDYPTVAAIPEISL
jgi:hypothetical protein